MEIGVFFVEVVDIDALYFFRRIEQIAIDARLVVGGVGKEQEDAFFFHCSWAGFMWKSFG